MIRGMRLLIATVLLSGPLFACSCINTGNECSAAGPSTTVFVARVLVDSGEGWGTGLARVMIEEPLFNVPQDLSDA